MCDAHVVVGSLLYDAVMLCYTPRCPDKYRAHTLCEARPAVTSLFVNTCDCASCTCDVVSVIKHNLQMQHDMLTLCPVIVCIGSRAW